MVAADLADGGREFRLAPAPAATAPEQPLHAERAHTEMYSVRRARVSSEAAVALQWKADLETCWEAFSRRLPAQRAPLGAPFGAPRSRSPPQGVRVPPVAPRAASAVIVDLSDSGDEECRLLRDT